MTKKGRSLAASTIGFRLFEARSLIHVKRTVHSGGLWIFAAASDDGGGSRIKAETLRMDCLQCVQRPRRLLISVLCASLQIVHHKMKSLTACIVLAGCIALAIAHSYHLGACPVVEPMAGFQMSRFLGNWYVIQKTSTASKCITYNYTRGDEPGEYIITQDSDIPILGLTALKHEYHYTGSLSVPEPSVPGRMTVRFPLSVAGSASHVVFTTDYENYAGIFTCQKLAFAHRQSATILSRTRDLDKAYIDKIRQKLSAFGVDPFDLSIIVQSNCPRGNNSLDVNVDPNTFTAQNFGNVVRKAGEKIGDGVEWIGEQGSKVYHKIAGTENKSVSMPQPSIPQAPSQLPPKDVAGKFENNEVEWIP